MDLNGLSLQEKENKYKELKHRYNTATVVFIVGLFSSSFLSVIMHFINDNIAAIIGGVGLVLSFILFIVLFGNCGQQMLDLNDSIIWDTLGEYFNAYSIDKKTDYHIKDIRGSEKYKIEYKDFEIYKNTYTSSKHAHDRTLVKIKTELNGYALYKLKSWDKKKVSKETLDFLDNILKKYNIDYLLLKDNYLYLSFMENIYDWNGDISNYKNELEKFKSNINDIADSLKEFIAV